MRPWWLLLGVGVLLGCWTGPIARLAEHAFYGHMLMHMGVVAVAAGLIAAGVAGSRYDPGKRYPRLFAAIPASAGELIVVWAWHAPALHQAARHHTIGLVAEQAMFLGCGLWVWISALGGAAPRRGDRTAAGVVGLLLTSMHMTLLGALLIFAPRPLYAHHADAMGHLPALTDQQWGGAIMILVGGASYLLGGLWLTAQLVSEPAADDNARLP